jgi:maltose O-acetyltransferase
MVLNLERISCVAREELRGVQPRYLAARLATSVLPAFVASRTRTWIWRMLGFKFGAESLLFGSLRLSGPGRIHERLHVGDGVWINDGCRIDLNGDVLLGDAVALGHEVLVLTSTHVVGRRSRRAGRLSVAPVVIEKGAWIGARAVILPGVHIGQGAIVASGAVVNKDVVADSIVAGSPARTTVERLPG